MILSKRIQQTAFLGISLASLASGPAQNKKEHRIVKNGMEVVWYHGEGRIFFEMRAPTTGWVAIGFNTSTHITGTYLIMGHMADDRPRIVEHYTIAPGNYRPIAVLGDQPQLDHTRGLEKEGRTELGFSLPSKNLGKYARNLAEGERYTMLLAFGREDDFQHHSVMRTAIDVKL